MKRNAVKVREINLERGMPTVDEAIRRMVNDLSTVKRTGCKAAVIVHGYGSSGTGGKIKPAAKSKLKEPSLQGIVKDMVAGENWYEKKKDFLNHCPQLADFNSYVDGNRGITVVLIK